MGALDWIDPSRGSATASGGAKKAQEQYGGLAGTQRGYQEQGLGRSLGAYDGLSAAYGAPGAFENFVGNGGADSGLSKYYDRMTQQATAGMNAQFANQGGFGAPQRMAALGNMNAGIEAQRGKDMAGYMAQSEGFQQGRLGGQAGLAGQQANLIQNAYGLGGQMYGNQMENSINSGMQGAAYQGQGQQARAGMGAGLLKLGIGGAMAAFGGPAGMAAGAKVASS